MRLEENKVNKAAKILSEKNQKIVITTHVNPDGDAIGSSLALYKFLKLSGNKNVTAITPNDYASFLKWMPGNDEIMIAENNPDAAANTITEADLIFCLDYNDIERTENLKQPLKNSKARTVLIDHHPQPGEGFDIVFSYINTSSTAEIVFKLIKAIDKGKLNKDIAACLFAGIMTDTGSFSYGCNNPETFTICAELIRTGINAENIHRLVYDTYSVSRMKLLGYCLNEKLTVLPEFNSAYICLTKKELEKFDHQEGDTEGVVNYALSIRNIDLAALFIEKDDHVKISLRSIGDVNVNDFAREFFNGGGHANAAGGKYLKNISSAVEYFESALAEFRKFENSQTLKP